VLAMGVIPNVMPTSPVLAQYTLYEYAVPYHCGYCYDEYDGVKEANYATTVNVHNPNPSTVTVQWKVVRTYPTPATKTSFNSLNIRYDQGQVFRCTNIWNRLGMGSGTYVTGFLVIRCQDHPLDVYATYTTKEWWYAAEGVGIGQSIDVEHIEAREIYVVP